MAVVFGVLAYDDGTEGVKVYARVLWPSCINFHDEDDEWLS